MRIAPRTQGRALWLLLIGALFALACNLTTIPPTPTASPVPPAQPTSAVAPTLFASITPLAGVGGIVATQAPNNSCIPPANWVQYTIETGDSLGALATATGSTLQDLISANCLTDPDTLYIGQVIYLPRSPISG